MQEAGADDDQHEQRVWHMREREQTLPLAAIDELPLAKGGYRLGSCRIAAKPADDNRHYSFSWQVE
ncbi:hypothetical protein PAT3040_04204 [Paenibacillus agaridevorans]|uniref:Uncharacterized protein n=1 Tax=Paenibacillus agaridevorans TaxID=171404 RepID=A0A2R5F1C6_9BACL|nr:hypothetical protein PAT3040_04204 [Paenibacillus agaridevorans]